LKWLEFNHESIAPEISNTDEIRHFHAAQKLAINKTSKTTRQCSNINGA